METLLERNLNYMRASLRGRDELAVRVQQALALPTKKEAAHVVSVVVQCIEATLLNNLGTDGFALKLDSFGKFSVRHKAGTLRKIPFTGKTILTKDKRKVRFVSLGELRQQEPVE
jgi:nucleoid DNA-binding protein